MDFSADQPELSITLKYLLENPALLQPPDSSECGEKCKDDKVENQGQHSDLTSAYLGPQIWSDMLLSDDLKLEPVDLDELLDTTGADDEMSDLGLLISDHHGNNEPYRNQQSAISQQDEHPVLSYDSMPPLVNVDSPSTKPVSSPSQYLCSSRLPEPHHQPWGSQPLRLNAHSSQASSSQQKLLEQQICEQQLAIFSEILENKNLQNQENKPLPSHSRVNRSQSIVSSNAGQQQNPAARLRQCISLDQSFATPADASESVVGEEPKVTSSPPVNPLSIRIPSPKRVNYVPNNADVIISTPVTLFQDDGEKAPFDPSTRAFTEEELKPQPIIRKSKKVYVPSDNKDGKYWNRRNKNNVAAKRSREARRIKENQIAMRANYLEQENSTLKTEVAELRQELTRVMKLVQSYESRFPGIQK